MDTGEKRQVQPERTASEPLLATTVSNGSYESDPSMLGYEVVNRPRHNRRVDPRLYRMFSNVPPTRISRRREFHLKPTNPIPLYHSYLGKYPNAVYRQTDLRFTVLLSELRNLLSKVSQLGARLSTVLPTQPENLAFFQKLSDKAQELLNKSTEDMHAAVRAIIFRLTSALQLTDRAQERVRSLANFRASLDSPKSFRDEAEVHSHNLTLMKPAVMERQIHALKFLTKKVELEVKNGQTSILTWKGAAELVKLVGEGRFKVALVEELYQSYQSVHEQLYPEVRFLRRNSVWSVSQQEISAMETKKEKLGYLRKLVRRTKVKNIYISAPQLPQKSLVSQSLFEKQARTVEKALKRGIFMSKNEILESAVRQIFIDREKLDAKRIYLKHQSLG